MSLDVMLCQPEPHGRNLSSSATGSMHGGVVGRAPLHRVDAAEGRRADLVRGLAGTRLRTNLPGFPALPERPLGVRDVRCLLRGRSPRRSSGAACSLPHPHPLGVRRIDEVGEGGHPPSYVRVPFGRVTGRVVDRDPNSARHMHRTRHLRPVGQLARLTDCEPGGARVNSRTVERRGLGALNPPSPVRAAARTARRTARPRCRASRRGRDQGQVVSWH
jgi:hypothetical protein